MHDGQAFHITGTTDDGAVTAHPCFLERICVNTPGDAGTITVADGATTKAIITMGTTAFVHELGIEIKTSLNVTVSEACDLTVVWT